MDKRTLLSIVKGDPTPCNFENIFENAEELQIRLFLDANCRKKDIWEKFTDAIALKDILGAYQALLDNQKLVFKKNILGISSKASEKIIKGYPKNKAQLGIYVQKLAGADFERVLKSQKWFKPNELKKLIKEYNIKILVGRPVFPANLIVPVEEVVLDYLRKIAPKGIPSKHKRPDQFMYMENRSFIENFLGVSAYEAEIMGDAISYHIMNNKALQKGIENILPEAEMIPKAKLTYQVLPTAKPEENPARQQAQKAQQQNLTAVVNFALTKVPGRTLKVKSESKPVRDFIVNKVYQSAENKLTFVVQPKTGKGRGGEFVFYIDDAEILLNGKDIVVPIKRKAVKFRLNKR